MTVDLSQKRELANAAKDLDQDPAFKQALEDLEKHWTNELMSAVSTEAKLEAIAKIKALKTLPNQLKAYIYDYNKSVLERQKHA